MILLTVQTVPVIRCNVEVQNKNCNIYVVCDRNQVSVLGTETKIQFQYWYRSRNGFYRNRIFCFQIFLMLPTSWEDISFCKHENKLFKNNLKVLKICKHIWF